MLNKDGNVVTCDEHPSWRGETDQDGWDHLQAEHKQLHHQLNHLELAPANRRLRRQARRPAAGRRRS